MSKPGVTRRWDEPKLEIGDPILMEEGLFGSGSRPLQAVR
jgi:hypothetical protein